MERIKDLNLYQKSIMILMLVMVVAFAVLYPMTISRVGYEYMGAILVPSQENGNTVYSGRLEGKQASFTVTEDKTVLFQYGDKSYGPYTARVDPTAVPKDSQVADYTTVVELRKGDEILFRGGVLALWDSYWLQNEDGTDYIVRVETGNVVDPFEPSATNILELMNKPQLTHKGMGFAWFFAVLICLINALTMLFADELFHWQVSLRVWNADRLEPSDLELAGRYVSCTVLSIMALFVFVIGLQ